VEPYFGLLSDRAQLWQDLMSGSIPAQIQAQSSDPLMIMKLPLNSRWHQNSPYNDDCPELTPRADEHCAVGCVATSLAQIMYYWKWPNRGVDHKGLVQKIHLSSISYSVSSKTIRVSMRYFKNWSSERVL